MKISEKADIIRLGGYFATVEDGEGRPSVFFIRHLGVRDSVFVEHIYREAIKEAKNLPSAPLSKLELIIECEKNGTWTKFHDKRIEELKSLIEQIDIELKISKKRAPLQVLRRKKAVEIELVRLLKVKQSIFSNCIEDFASQEKTRAIVYLSACNEMGERHWNNWEEFSDVRDTDLIENLAAAIQNGPPIDGNDIRQVAKTVEWRNCWSAGKKSDLFGEPVALLDTQRQTLLYWSQFYDSIYNSLDRPDESVIMDDDKLDEWLKEQDRKNKVKKVSKGDGYVGNTKLSSRVSKHGEVFVCVNPVMNKDAPSIEEVDAMNPEHIRKMKIKDGERIKKAGALNEKVLRGDKASRMIIGSSDNLLKSNAIGGKSKMSDGRKMPGGTLMDGQRVRKQ